MTIFAGDFLARLTDSSFLLNTPPTIWKSKSRGIVSKRQDATSALESTGRV
jgi:hypothetical protein